MTHLLLCYVRLGYIILILLYKNRPVMVFIIYISQRVRRYKGVKLHLGIINTKKEEEKKKG